MAVSKRLRYEILRRDGRACQYCGRTAPEVKLTVDHVKPTALGGSDEPSNLVAACQDCNSGKTSTNPDAPLVERVAEDALRWSRAINVAAEQMLAQHEAFSGQLAEFHEAWSGWRYGPQDDRRPVPLPGDWKRSIEMFLAASLPLTIVLDCVDKAMNTQRVKAAETFRYMCGIAWKKIEELQKAAQDGVGRPVAVAPPATSADSLLAGRAHFAGEILSDFVADEDRSRALTDARASLEENGDPFTDEQVTIDAAHEAMASATWERSRLEIAVRALLATFPSEEVSRAKAMNSHELERSGHTDPVTDVENLGTVAVWLATFRDFVALPEAEKAEWLACVTAAGEATPDLEFTAAEYAERCKEYGNYALPGNCVGLGEHGAMCPQRATFNVLLDHSCSREKDDTRCIGHPMCRTHAEQEVDEDILDAAEARYETVNV